MTTTAPAPPLILIAANPEHSLAGVLEGEHYAVVQVHTGTLALEWVRDVRPDVIILDADLPDMSGIDACRLLHSDLRIGHTVPTLILALHKPTPEQRVAALRAGVWDFLSYPPDPGARSADVACARGTRVRGVRPGSRSCGPQGGKRRGPQRAGVRRRWHVESDRVRRARASHRSRGRGQARPAYRRRIARRSRRDRLLRFQLSTPGRLRRRNEPEVFADRPRRLAVASHDRGSNRHTRAGLLVDASFRRSQSVGPG